MLLIWQPKFNFNNLRGSTTWSNIPKQYKITLITLSFTLCKKVRKPVCLADKVNLCSFGPTVGAAWLGSTTKTFLTCSSIQETEIMQHDTSSITDLEGWLLSIKHMLKTTENSQKWGRLKESIQFSGNTFK